MIGRDVNVPGAQLPPTGPQPAAPIGTPTKVRDSFRGAEPASAPEGAERTPEERAEEMVDHLAERLSEFGATVKRKVSQVIARAREEAEDIWAEAQSLRRGEQ